MDDTTGELLAQAWSALGGAADLLDLVEVSGDGAGLLPSTLPALPAMTAAVSAATLAASVLDGARRSRAAEPVQVDVRHVAVAAGSERYARMDATPEVALFAPLSTFWPVADGWVRLHTNYAWHHERALRVLACDDRPEAVSAAIRSWSGPDLEDALAAAGAVGSAVRTQAQWRAHPQGDALARRPLLDRAVGTSVGRPAGNGVARILDLTRVIAGPVATRTLAGWGADVLRLDSPHLPELPSLAVDTLVGKRSALLDISGPAGHARLEELLAQADVLVHGYRPGALTRHGLAQESLAERHPHLSVVTLSAWGDTGSWSTRRGFDSLVQCATGIAELEGRDARPGTLPAQVLDHSTGYLAAAAALLALAGVARGEPPQSVTLSLAQTAQWLLAVGPTERQDARDLSAERYLVTLAGAARPVHVIAPPGRVGGRRPRWTATTDYGSDPPRWST